MVFFLAIYINCCSTCHTKCNLKKNQLANLNKFQSKDDEQKGPIQRLSKQSGTTGAGGIIEPTAAEQKTEEEQIDEQKEQIPKPPRAIRPPRHAQSEQMLRIGSAERRRFRLPDALANSNNGNATVIKRPMSVIFTGYFCYVLLIKL